MDSVPSMKVVVPKGSNASCVLSHIVAFGPISLEDLVERIEVLDSRPERPNEQQIRAIVSEFLDLNVIRQNVDCQLEIPPARPRQIVH